MISRIALALVTLSLSAVSGVAATLGASGCDTCARTANMPRECYEMPAYKWDPEAQTNVFVGYRRICR